MKVTRAKIKPRTPFSFFGKSAISKIERQTVVKNPKRKKNQYSERLALPLKIAYF
jgi:hypothetical protein